MMMNKSMVAVAGFMLIGGALFAGPKHKLTQVNVCPMTGDPSAGSKLTSRVGNYVVHFCCKDCPAAFNKLSMKDKMKKIHAAMAKPVVKKTAMATVKPIVVMTCPMTGEKVTGAGAGSTMVGNYEVHFCCAGCPAAFAKLSKADQLAKVQSVLPKG